MNTQKDEINILNLNQLVNFKEHPFKVETDTELFELMQSIEKAFAYRMKLEAMNRQGN